MVQFEQPTVSLTGIRVLVVDDEPDLCLGLKKIISSTGAEVNAVHSAEHALAHLEQSPSDIVLSDIKMGGMSGIELQKKITESWRLTSVVLMTGFGTIDMAVECLHNGAAHFITKPFDNDDILDTVTRLGRSVLARSNESGDSADGIVAVDPKMKEVLRLVGQVAPTNIPVLLAGESGTGKELLARAIHRRSSVNAGRLVTVNCAALPDTLMESELFGYRKGAFTGAEKNHEGLFRQAHDGTIFLDEVPSMSPALQAKLLRVLQEKKIRPLGGNEEEYTAFRVVSATNKNLQSLVEEESFREDLYYRLSGFVIELPPLREHPADIIPLAEHFLRTAAETHFGDTTLAPVLSDAAADILCNHPWKGNVRELEHTIHRAAVLCNGRDIQPRHLMLENGSNGTAHYKDNQGTYELAKQEVLDAFQRRFLCRVLQRTHGNISQAAEECGLTRAAIQKMMRKLNIDRTCFNGQ